jgi:Ser/Thr protein kinase RdoA (MazF antagonist)
MTDLAATALARYPIDVSSLRLVQQGFNATFRVDGTSSADGRSARWALRLNAQGLRSPAETAAELAWIDSLGQGGDVRVARVARDLDDRTMVGVPSEPLGREVVAVVFEWLPGRLLQEDPRPGEVRRLGRLTALLHANGQRWRPPRGASLGRIDDARMGLDDHLSDHPLLDATQRSIIREVSDRADTAFDALRTRHRGHVIHGDLHPGNLMTAAGTLSVLDFDDCGISHPLHDLAITAYHLRPTEHEGELYRGYESVRPLPEHTTDEFESVVAARNVALLNDTVTVNAAWVADVLPTYIPNTVTKLRNYLDTGTYRHDVDGLVG